MKREDKLAHDLARLEAAQRRSREQLQRAQEQMERKFASIRERLLKKYGEPSERQQRIIRAALELLRADGLSNLSLRRLAKALDMQAPALYWHFKSKDALVDFLAEAILQEQFKDLMPRTADEPWQDWLITLMKRLRLAMLAYPDGARIVAGAHLYPAVTLAQLSETALESLIAAGVGPQTARSVVLAAKDYTFGHVIEEQSNPTPEQLEHTDVKAFLESFPRLRQAVQTSARTYADPEEFFVVGLRYLIAGAMLASSESVN